MCEQSRSSGATAETFLWTLNVLASFAASNAYAPCNRLVGRLVR
jgi:hypothetical protein